MIQDVKGNPVLSAIDVIFLKGHKSKFLESFQNSVSREAQIIKNYLGIESLNQAMTFAMLLGMGDQTSIQLNYDIAENPKKWIKPLRMGNQVTVDQKNGKST